MDGSFPLQRDPDLASPVPDADKWRQEIAEAKQGLRAKISTKAAAHYVGVHHTTLREWVREGQGPQPMQNPAKAGTTARNQHLGFTMDALDAFLANRSGEPITRGKRTDADDVVRKAERIEALIALKEAEDRLAKARARARRLGVVAYALLADVLEIQPWVTLGGRIAGHAWAVDEATFNAADEDQWEGTLEEALAQPWISTDARQAYQDAFVAVLTGTQHLIEAARSRQLASDLEERWDSANHEAKPVRPFGKERGRL
ncbi:helix-turn-helix domain-containing protein [Stenotrophomonas lactitubi]|uniref:helix-turn-helix domain-containing protein n=1 Tax=Stenotrophomonas lactitubi TaxID=2045214 RepID=UPI00203CFF25|nr:helix-turn-helix domain-containing protein [Stenotrophomonas lactitubi]